jgi:hypothetical protein
MVYDEARRQVVLFGGQEAVQNPDAAGQGLSVLKETWTWDGKTWSQQAPVTSPPAAYRPVLVYDAKLGRGVALVDVYSEVTQKTTPQTWTWDGSTWAQLHPSTERPGPGFSVAAYDAADGAVVVFGGNVCTGGMQCTVVGDTWTFDGKTWTRHAAAAGGPPGRGPAALAYDPSGGKVVMFGGVGSVGTFLNDTWTWDGTRWTQAHPAASPWERSGALAASDTADGQVILYGGGANSQYFGVSYSDVWTWAQGSWALVQPTTISTPPDEQEAIVTAASLGPGLRASCTGASPPCMSVRGQPQLGSYAAFVVFDLNPPQGSNTLCISYVSYISGSYGTALGPWHQVGVACAPSDGHVLQLGAHAQVAVTGCANVRTFPVDGAVVSCLPKGTQVTIDDGPVAYLGNTKRLWWHLQQRGWVAHELLAAG